MPGDGFRRMVTSHLLRIRAHYEDELDCAEQVIHQWPALYRATSPPLRTDLAHINAELARRIPEITHASHT